MSSPKEHVASGTHKEFPHPSHPNLSTGVVKADPTGSSIAEKKRPNVEQEDVRGAASLHENVPHVIHREAWEDSLSSPSPSSSSYRDSSGDDTESQYTNPDEGHGVMTSDDDKFGGANASTRSRQYKIPKKKEAGIKLRKRGRPVVKDPENDSDSSIKQARHMKKPKAYRDTRSVYRVRPRLWDVIPEHHYFFEDTVPKDWHVKNQNPRIYELDDLVEKDIKKLSYPIEIKICRGQLAEIENWQDLKEYMEDRNIAPVCSSPIPDDLSEYDDAEPPLANAALPTPSTVHGQAIDPKSMPSSRSHNAIHIDRSDKRSNDISEDRIPYRATHSKTAVNTKSPQQSPRVVLQAKFLEEVRLHASLAPDNSELYNKTPRVELQLVNFINGVKESLNKYHETLQQHTQLGTSKSDIPQDVDHGGSHFRATQTRAEQYHVGVLGSTKSPIKDKSTPGPSKGMQKDYPLLAKKDSGGNANKQLGTEASSAFIVKKEPDLDAALKDTIVASLSRVAGLDRSKPSKTRLPQCDFCKKPPVAPRLTQCQHVICFECYSDAVDEAYLKTHSYPKCPTCGEYITAKPSLC